MPSPGDLPNPEIKPRSPTLQADSLPSELPGKLIVHRFPFLLSCKMLSATTPPLHPPFKGITLTVQQHVRRLFHLQHRIRPAREREARQRRVGAGWSHNASSTAPQGRGHRGQDPPPPQTPLGHTPGMSNRCWSQLKTSPGGEGCGRGRNQDRSSVRPTHLRTS